LAGTSPPKNEQRRIVAKLDDLFARTSRAREELDRVPTLVEHYKHAILFAAFHGELRANWCEDPQPNLSSPGIAPIADDEAFSLPPKWIRARLGDLTDNFDGRRIPLKQSDRGTRHRPYPYYGAFGVIDSVDSYLFDGNFLLVAEDGKNLESRKRPIAFQAHGRFWVNNHAHVLRARDCVDCSYLEHFLNSPVLALQPFLTGIDQVKLTKGALENIPIPLPPLSEQLAIVRRIDAVFARLTAIAAEHASVITELDRLDKKLLTKAFRGELVPQDPADEPAGAWLNRIRESSKDRAWRKHRRQKLVPKK
jgi:type I restriction enzyme S subunit